jgi:CheY-like chemotaxis protein
VSTAPSSRLLIVEDERHLAAGLKLNFEFEGFEVDLAGTSREAAALLARSTPYAAIVLDVSLPDTDGFTFCGRRNGEHGPYCREHAQVAYQQPQPGKKNGGATELARSLRRYI